MATTATATATATSPTWAPEASTPSLDDLLSYDFSCNPNDFDLNLLGSDYGAGGISLENMTADSLEIDIGSFIIMDAPPQIHPGTTTTTTNVTSYGTSPSPQDILNNANMCQPPELKPEEAQWYETIAYTTQLDEWSQKILEQCWFPQWYTCGSGNGGGPLTSSFDHNEGVLDDRERRITWGTLIMWYIIQGWLVRYDDQESSSGTGAEGAENISGDAMEAMPLEGVGKLDRYTLSLEGRNEVMKAMGSEWVELGNPLVNVVDPEMEAIMDEMMVLGLGPSVDTVQSCGQVSW